MRCVALLVEKLFFVSSNEEKSYIFIRPGRWQYKAMWKEQLALATIVQSLAPQLLLLLRLLFQIFSPTGGYARG